MEKEVRVALGSVIIIFLMIFLLIVYGLIVYVSQGSGSSFQTIAGYLSVGLVILVALLIICFSDIFKN